jgi:hypothetical protein
MSLSLSAPRYRYLIKVDEAAIEFCLVADYERVDSGSVGYVNVINSTWTVPSHEDFSSIDDEKIVE